MATVNKNLSEYDRNTLISAKNLKIAIIVSEWNDTITNGLYKGAFDVFVDCGADEKDIHRYNVPGSFELVFGAKKALETQNYDAVIVIGCVIEGETRHFDYVCEGVTQGITNLNLKYNTPTIFCVLTDRVMEQSIARSGGIHGNKGTEAAVAALKMVDFNNQIEALTAKNKA